jgi:hypothetical protein
MKDPFPIYKAGETSRKVHYVDFPGWEANGWSTEPQPELEPEVIEETPPELSTYEQRKLELEELYRNKGWQAIAAICKKIGITRPATGFDDAIPLILEKEGLVKES